MISITCTNCQAKLQMDDAFAGGVCRCMYCGTIQTVPSHLKKSNGKKSTPQPAKALFQHSAVISRDEPDSSENAAPSSGLAGSGLISGRLRAQTIAPSKPPHRTILLLGICGAGALLLLVMILWFVAA